MVELRSRVTLRGKPIGTIIERVNGYKFVRTRTGTRPESQLVAEQRMLNRELHPDERVFHRDCTERGNNSPDNLVVIRINKNPWRPLPQARIIYIPKREGIPA